LDSATSQSEKHLGQEIEMYSLYSHKDAIIKAVRAISPSNYLVVGVRRDGTLQTDEACDSSTRFHPEDVVEQTSFRGGASALLIEEKLLALEA
jgi:hypothetical protein